MDTIITKIRNLREDNLNTSGVDNFTFESSTSSKIFTLTQANVSTSTIIVYKNGVVWASSNYSYSATTGKLTVTGSLTAGDTLQINYSYYEKYSDSELRGFIRAAISYLSIEQYKTFTAGSDNVVYPTPTESEENLLAVVAVILMVGDVVSYRTPEITISFARGDNKEKKIKKVIRQFKKTLGVLGFVKFDEKIVNEEDPRVF